MYNVQGPQKIQLSKKLLEIHFEYEVPTVIN